MKNAKRKCVLMILLVIALSLSCLAFPAQAHGSKSDNNYLNYYSWKTTFTFDDGTTMHHSNEKATAILGIHVSSGFIFGELFRITAYVHGSDGTVIKSVKWVDNRNAHNSDEYAEEAFLRIEIDPAKLNDDPEHVSFCCAYQVEKIEIPDDEYYYEVVACSDMINCATELHFGNPCERYGDINKSSWYHKGVDFALSSGLYQGVSVNRFDPDGLMTRGMLVTVLWRWAGEPDPTEQSGFLDVSGNAYYAKAVAWAEMLGIINGYSKTVFAPNDPITREQLVTILLRMGRTGNLLPIYNREKRNMGESLLRTAFDDADQISDYAKEAAVWAVERQYMKGVAPNLFGPKLYATRAQVAVILQRIQEDKVFR